MTDWEKRAQEIYYEIYMSLSPEEKHANAWMSGPWRNRGALQLAREMADARAEEIARRIDLVNVHSTVGRTTEELCAAIARSFITKSEPRESPVMPKLTDEINFQRLEKLAASLDAGEEPETATDVAMQKYEERRREKYKAAEAAIRADERKRIEVYLTERACGLAANLVGELNRPKSRERVLEEALRKLERQCIPDASGGYDASREDYLTIIRRALEWKP